MAALGIVMGVYWTVNAVLYATGVREPTQFTSVLYSGLIALLTFAYTAARRWSR